MGATVTERITSEISRQGRFKRGVAELAGINPSTFYTRCARDDWRTGELRRLARVLQVRFETLAGA
jgi:hypothetical protein